MERPTDEASLSRPLSQLIFPPTMFLGVLLVLVGWPVTAAFVLLFLAGLQFFWPSWQKTLVIATTSG